MTYEIEVRRSDCTIREPFIGLAIKTDANGIRSVVEVATGTKKQVNDLLSHWLKKN